MSNNNRISAVLTAADLASAEASLDSVRPKLPFLISLTSDARSKLLKLGDGRVALDEDAHALMQDHPTLVPSYIDKVELEKDRTLRQQLDGLRLSVQALLDDIESTEMQLGAEMLQVYLGFYSNAKEAEKRGIPAAKTVVDVLGKYFARSGKATPAAATPNP
ncbi:MAG: hypothetical protein ABI162_01705 [Luteolibacter sp.]